MATWCGQTTTQGAPAGATGHIWVLIPTPVVAGGQENLPKYDPDVGFQVPLY